MSGKRLFTAFLALLLLAGTFASCGSETETEETESTETFDTVAEEETTLKPNLPEADYEGHVFRILTPVGRYSYVVSTEQTGEVVNDAVYDANEAVGDMFNISFANIDCASDSDPEIIRAYIMANEDAFDAAMFYDCASGSISLNGWFVNVYDLPYVDTTQPWWPQFTVDSLTLNGQMYLISNYSSWRAMSETRVTFFNRALLEDYHLSSPYDMVRDGTWTLDRLAELTAGVWQDMNGDGKQDKDDVFGFAFTDRTYCWMESFGIEAYQKTADDSPELVLTAGSEQVVGLVDKLYSWLCSGDNSVWFKTGNARTEAMEMFANGNALFTFKSIGDQIAYLKDSELSYGIVPFPKLDETVAEYTSACTDQPISIPITASNMERTGTIVEAMAWAGYTHILPAYCDKTLKGRYSDDEDSAEMLDLIFQNRVLSFSYLFMEMGPGMQLRLLVSTVGANNNDVASYYAKYEKAEKSVMNQIIAFYSGDTTAES